MGCKSKKKHPDIDNKANTSYYKIVGLSIIIIGALVIRLYPVLNSPEKIKYGFGPFGDTFYYHRVAYNLCNGNGFSATDDGGAFGVGKKNIDIEYEPTITRGPVYPFFMYIAYKTLGNQEDMESLEDWHKNLNKVRIVQCVIDAAICLLVFFIVRLIYPSFFLGALISAFLYCFSFYNIFYTKALLSESLTTFLMTWFIFFCVLGLKNQKKFWLFPAGAVFGLVLLSRFEYVFFLFILIIYICFINRRSWSVAVKSCVIFIIGTIIVISPWTVRNYIAFKKPILVSTGTLGYKLWQGTFETNKIWGGWGGRYLDEILTSEQEKMEVMAWGKDFNTYLRTGSIKIKDIDKLFMKLALGRIKNDPLQCFQNWIKKIPRLWYQSYIQMYVYKEASGNFFIFYFVFGLYAIWAGTKQEKILMAPIWFLFVYLTIIFLPLGVEPRYGVALMPGIISLTGIGIWKLTSNIFYKIKSFYQDHK